MGFFIEGIQENPRDCLLLLAVLHVGTKVVSRASPRARVLTKVLVISSRRLPTRSPFLRLSVVIGSPCSCPLSPGALHSALRHRKCYSPVFALACFEARQRCGRYRSLFRGVRSSKGSHLSQKGQKVPSHCPAFSKGPTTILPLPKQLLLFSYFCANTSCPLVNYELGNI